jgi:hypothetical protein
MPDISSTSWFPVLTLLIGYGTKSLTDWFQHRRAVQREREAREATRQDQLFERRATFQRETLLALQEAAMKLGRATGAIHHKDIMALRTTGKQQLLPADLDEDYRVAQARTSMLASRVRDNAVRELVEQFRKFSTESTLVKTQEDNRALTAMMQIHDQLNQRIGELLRTLDDADAAQERGSKSP